ncbi:MAG TPA: shikimate kinase [Lachnospiraceae bacterium]|nr:shikimate kinase [Lachnospiraceae bacterium]
MINTKSNIVLIGMPGAGKSTVGVVAAKRMGYRFVDSDLVIQETYGKLLYELIDEYGIEGFWELENQVNASLNPDKSVIATGGSVCYEEEAMEHLSRIGCVVYLNLTYDSLVERLGDLNARGVTFRPEQTLLDLYKERTPLYEKYAHITIDCEGKQLREIAAEVCDRASELSMI